MLLAYVLLAQMVTVEPTPSDPETLYSFCTGRYVERDKVRKLKFKWQKGYEVCEDVVNKHDRVKK